MLNGATKQEIRKLFDTSQPPELGPGPRQGIKPGAELNKSLERALDQSTGNGKSRELIKALVLLWHDHLEAAHEIAQGIADSTGSFIHAIMHRREPDYGNSAYWFRRVGKHPSFDEIAIRAVKVLKGDAKLSQKVIPRGEWDPFAFVNACEIAARNSAEHQQ